MKRRRELGVSESEDVMEDEDDDEDEEDDDDLDDSATGFLFSDIATADVLWSDVCEVYVGNSSIFVLAC